MRVSSPSERAWRWRVFAITWLVYAAYYFCRKNFSVEMPLLEHEFGYSNLQLATVVFGYSLFYALGQFCSGILSDHFGPRKVVGIGMLIVAVANFAMGFQMSLIAFGLLGCLNGAAQSTGWPGLVKNMASWFKREERGVVMGWWGTNYALGGFVATIFATFVVTQLKLFSNWGWRRGFWLPAAVVVVIAIAYVTLVRDRPSDVGLTDIEDDAPLVQSGKQSKGDEKAGGAPQGALSIFRKLISEKTIWIVSGTFFLLKMTRYGFLFWLPVYMTQQLHYSVKDAGYTSSLYELVGFSGALLAGYASDRLFHSRRPPVIALMLWGLALACLVQPVLAGYGHWGNIAGVCLIGIMTFGPDTLISGATAQDLGTTQGAATAAGFIDGVGSLGQLGSPFVVALISAHYGWNVLFYTFVLLAAAAGALMATRWKYLPAAASQAVANAMELEKSV